MWLLRSATLCCTRSPADMEQYIIKDGKQLRLGYTTGSCAAAAAKAAAWMLLSGHRKETVSLLTPKGIPLELAVQEIAYLTNLTCRQAFSVLSGMAPDVELCRHNTYRGTVVTAVFRGDKCEAEDRMRRVVAERYRITEEMRVSVDTMLIGAGWTTLNTLAEGTGLSKMTVAHTLDTIPGVELRVAGGTNLYCKTGVD